MDEFEIIVKIFKNLKLNLNPKEEKKTNGCIFKNHDFFFTYQIKKKFFF